jgi:hypothetical protein
MQVYWKLWFQLSKLMRIAAGGFWLITENHIIQQVHSSKLVCMLKFNTSMSIHMCDNIYLQQTHNFLATITTLT